MSFEEKTIIFDGCFLLLILFHNIYVAQKYYGKTKQKWTFIVAQETWILQVSISYRQRDYCSRRGTVIFPVDSELSLHLRQRICCKYLMLKAEDSKQLSCYSKALIIIKYYDNNKNIQKIDEVIKKAKLHCSLRNKKLKKMAP